MATPTTAAICAAVLLCAAAFHAADAAGGRHPKPTAAVVASVGGRLLEDTALDADTLVTVACANVSRHNYLGPGLTEDFCELAFWSDKRTASATRPRDLALLAIDFVRDGAAGAGAKVGGAAAAPAAKNLSRDAALNLRYCQLDYEDVARTVPVCQEMVQEYEPASGDGRGPMIAYNYVECAGRMMSAAVDCWSRIVNDQETKKAVWKEVSDVAYRTNLAKAMVEQMLGIVDDVFVNKDDDAAADDDDDDDDNNSRHHHHVVDDDDHHHHVFNGKHHGNDDDDDDFHHHVDDDDDD
ncbi:unnamed protein product [Urochloa humidicola]